MSAHQYLRFVEHPAERPIVRELSVGILNRYNPGPAKKRQQWRDMGTFQFNWWIDQRDSNGVATKANKTTKPISLHVIEQHLRMFDRFDWRGFDMMDPGCPWLDSEIRASQNYHFIDAETGEPLALALTSGLGEKFPAAPNLDREGWIISSFQRSLAIRIHNLRTRVVETSDAFSGNEDWLQDLRACISDAVSLIDITLHQAYSKAEYDPLDGWTFSRERLGSAFGRRLGDKLKWVHLITGKPLHAKDELAAFRCLKGLRNHLQHFDPPCFACTLEEAAAWLNLIPMVGVLAKRIRDCLGSPVSSELMALILARPVAFFPSDPQCPRKPPAGKTGYASIAFPKEEPAPTPTATLDRGDVEQLLSLVDELRAKSDDKRAALTKKILELMTQTHGIEAASAEAERRGIKS